jgi:hypothetical protein
MLCWGALELSLSRNCPLDVYPRHFLLLRESVCQYHNVLTMKEIQYPELDLAGPNPQLVYAIAQIIAQGSSQFVTILPKYFNSRCALRDAASVAATDFL